MSDPRDDEMDALIKRAFDPVMAEPIPARLQVRASPWMPRLRAAAVFLLGAALGLVAAPYVMPQKEAPVTAAANFPMRAARAHAVFVSEVRHPVEVDASQQEHLVAWLSKRL